MEVGFGLPTWKRPQLRNDRRRKLFHGRRRQFASQDLPPRQNALLSLVLREFVAAEVKILRNIRFLSRNASISGVFEAIGTGETVTRKHIAELMRAQRYFPQVKHLRSLLHVLGSKDGETVGREAFMRSIICLLALAEHASPEHKASDDDTDPPFTTGFSAEPVAVHAFAQIVAAEVRLDQYRSILLEEPGFNLRRAFAAVAAPDARVISSADVESYLNEAHAKAAGGVTLVRAALSRFSSDGRPFIGFRGFSAIVLGEPIFPEDVDAERLAELEALPRRGAEERAEGGEGAAGADASAFAREAASAVEAVGRISALGGAALEPGPGAGAASTASWARPRSR